MGKMDLDKKALKDAAVRIQSAATDDVRNEAFNGVVKRAKRLLTDIMNKNRIDTPNCDYDDKYNAALYGLYVALLTWNSEKSEISTYIYKCVSNELIQLERHCGDGMSHSTRKQYADMHTIYADKGLDGLKEAGYKDIAIRHFLEYERRPKKKLSLDDIQDIEGDRRMPSRMCVDEAVDDMCASEQLQSYLSLLDEREQYILIQHVVYERPYVAIGKDLGVSKQRVKQIEDTALSRIRSTIKDNNE